MHIVGFVVCLMLACVVPATAQESATQKPSNALVSADNPAQLKATIIKLQKAVLALRKENGMLQATVAELQDAALEAAIETLPADVKKALGRPEQKSAEKPAPKE